MLFLLKKTLQKLLLLMEQFINYFEHPTVQKLVAVIIGSLFILVITSFVKNIVPRYIKDTNNRYRTRKFINYVGYFLIIIVTLKK